MIIWAKKYSRPSLSYELFGVFHLLRLVTWKRRITVANKQTDRYNVNLYMDCGRGGSLSTATCLKTCSLYNIFGGISLAKVGHLEAKNNCCKQTDRYDVNLYMDCGRGESQTVTKMR